MSNAVLLWIVVGAAAVGVVALVVTARRARRARMLRDAADLLVDRVPSGDARMLAAMEEATRTFDDFVNALGSGDERCCEFNAKVGLPTRRLTVEHIWLSDVALTEDAGVLEGVIANDPIDIPVLKLGQRVKFGRDNVSDWMYMRDGEMVGGFTILASMERKPALAGGLRRVGLVREE